MEEDAEAAIGENITPTESSPSKSKGQTRRAPNRQKFEEDLNEIKQQIEAKEQHLQNILGNGKDSPQAKLQQLRDRREAANQRRRNISTQLEALNQQINNKRDATSQLRSKLQYQTEAQVEEVVRRLEAQLQNHSFRLAEERRLVAEIDKLRRSKKSVKQYIDAKDELTKLRDSQQQLRAERDSISRELLSLRGEEDTIHADIRKNRDVADVLKKELDELHAQKRTRVTEFKADQSSYAQYREQRRSDLGRQRVHEKLTQVRSQDREPAVPISIEPYLEERQLCTTLLSFLSKLDGTPSATPVTPASCASSVASTPMSPDDARSRVPGFFEDNMDILFAGIPRKNSRKVKRSLSRASMNKKRLVPLTPDLLVQFATLSITAPTCLAEVPAAVETLKAKQKLYSCMAAAELRNDCATAETVELDRTAATVELDSKSLSLELNEETISDIRQLPTSLDLSPSPNSETTNLTLAVPQRNKPPETLNLKLTSESPVEVTSTEDQQTSLLNGTTDTTKL